MSDEETTQTVAAPIRRRWLWVIIGIVLAAVLLVALKPSFAGDAKSSPQHTRACTMDREHVEGDGDIVLVWPACFTDLRPMTLEQRIQVVTAGLQDPAALRAWSLCAAEIDAIRASQSAAYDPELLAQAAQLARGAEVPCLAIDVFVVQKALVSVTIDGQARQAVVSDYDVTSLAGIRPAEFFARTNRCAAKLGAGSALLQRQASNHQITMVQQAQVAC